MLMWKPSKLLNSTADMTRWSAGPQRNQSMPSDAVDANLNNILHDIHICAGAKWTGEPGKRKKNDNWRFVLGIEMDKMQLTVGYVGLVRGIWTASSWLKF